MVFLGASRVSPRTPKCVRGRPNGPCGLLGPKLYLPGPKVAVVNFLAGFGPKQMTYCQINYHFEGNPTASGTSIFMVLWQYVICFGPNLAKKFTTATLGPGRYKGPEGHKGRSGDL